MPEQPAHSKIGDPLAADVDGLDVEFQRNKTNGGAARAQRQASMVGSFSAG